MKEELLRQFVAESNRIEGILREPFDVEAWATQEFINTAPTVDAVKKLVSVYQPDAVIGDQLNLNVRVGNHIPPPGGLLVVEELTEILRRAKSDWHPYDIHCQYESLHPFTDGNGRSDRAIWLWQMVDQYDYNGALGFLQRFYYQALDYSRRS